MIAVQEPLWRDGWDVEPCGGGPSEPARRPRTRRRRADSPHTEPVRPSFADYGRPAARPRIAWRPVHTVTVRGGVL